MATDNPEKGKRASTKAVKSKMLRFLRYYELPGFGIIDASLAAGLSKRTANHWFLTAKKIINEGESHLNEDLYRWFFEKAKKAKPKIRADLQRARINAALALDKNGNPIEDKEPNTQICEKLLQEAERKAFNPVTQIKSEHTQTINANIHILQRVEEIKNMSPAEVTLNIDNLAKELGKNGSIDSPIPATRTTALIGEGEGIAQGE